MKYVYLYKISFIRDDKEHAFYIGLRSCSCEPQEDLYLGSPKRHKNLWKNSSFTIEKKILRVGSFDQYDEFRNEESVLIKEAWTEHGYFGNEGKCLNATSGKSIHHYLAGKPRSYKKYLDHLNRKDLSDIIKRGQERSRLAGIRIGRPTNYSSDLDADIKKLRDSGMAIKKIAKTYHIGVCTVYKVLKNES